MHTNKKSIMNIVPFHVDVDGLRLRGSHYLPVGDGPFPTAILFHGFGSSRVEFSSMFVALARRLADRGIASIAYDRAGHGESDGTFFDTTVSRDVTHAQAVIDAVAALPSADADNLHLVGISLGAVVASVVAAEATRPVRSASMWSTAAVFADEISSGMLQGRSLDALDTDGYFDFLGTRLGPAMRDDATSFDVYGRASGFSGAVNLMHGTADFVPVSYAERYADVYGERAQILIVEGADHGWTRVPDRDLLYSRTVDFIADQAGGSR